MLQLEEKNFTRLCTTKSMLVVNGQFPGPAIHVRRGDTAFVNAHNNRKYGVTIHWCIYVYKHIILLNKSQYMILVL